MSNVTEFQLIPATSPRPRNAPRVKLVQREVHRALMPECGTPVLSGPCSQTAELGKTSCYYHGKPDIDDGAQSRRSPGRMTPTQRPGSHHGLRGGATLPRLHEIRPTDPEFPTDSRATA